MIILIYTQSIFCVSVDSESTIRSEIMVDDRNISVEERLAKAKKPGQDAMKMHPYYGGKVEVVPKACVRSFDDFAIWYSPGVA